MKFEEYLLQIGCRFCYHHESDKWAWIDSTNTPWTHTDLQAAWVGFQGYMRGRGMEVL